MRLSINKILVRTVLAVAIAIPATAMVQVGSADAGHRHWRGAAIAGAIIGGAIIYHHHRKHRKYRKYRHHRSYHRSYGRRYYPRRVIVYRNYGGRHHHHGYHRHYYDHHHGRPYGETIK